MRARRLGFNDYFRPANLVYGIGSASQYSANASRKPAVMNVIDWLSSFVNLTNSAASVSPHTRG